MSDTELLNSAYQALSKAQAEIKRLKEAAHQPIAIIGMGCRYPGGITDEDSFWDVLIKAKDTISEVPKNRFDIADYFSENITAAGKMNSKYGGFIDDIEAFDAKFFGISAAEAVSIDPQQRLLLETSWEALECAGIAPKSLSGSDTGVYIGICGADYADLYSPSINHLDFFTATGNSPSIASGRLAYTLGLQGPNLAIDAACASSLVCVHLACQSLRNYETSLAIAGGVNVILTPNTTVCFSKANTLAPDGRCKTFDAQADGYVRSEGCGVLILKRLQDALDDHDHILAVIKGSATNHGGFSASITAPNGTSQMKVIQRALNDAGVSANAIDYVEAHGTGTALGDQVEFNALANVFGKDRTKPLTLGSVKTNLGHTEGAAGIAGIIKVMLAMKHQTIPPHLHLKQVHSQIDLQKIPAEIPTQATAWRANDTRYASVHAFAFNGVNAHVVLAEPPIATQSSTQDSSHLVTLSAKDESSLKLLAQQYVKFLMSHPTISFDSFAYTTTVGRSHFDYRKAYIAADAETLIAQLKADQAYAKQVGPSKVIWECCETLHSSNEMIVLISAEFPAFKPILEELIARIANAYDETNAIHRSLIFQCALAKLIKSWQIKFTFIGVGQAGIVAKCLAGVIKVEEALRLLALGSNDADQTCYCYDSLNVKQMTSKQDAHTYYHTENYLKFDPSGLKNGALIISELVKNTYLRGANISWSQFYSGRPINKIAIPTYPFQREHYWPKHATTHAVIKDELQALNRDELHDKVFLLTNQQEQLRAIELLLINEIAGLLECPVDQIEPETPLLYMGLDSILGYQLFNKISEQLKIELPISIFNEKISIRLIALEVQRCIAAKPIAQVERVSS